MLMLLLACTWGVEADPLAAQREAERVRAAAAPGEEVCLVVRRCDRARALAPAEDAPLYDQMQYDGDARMMAPMCDAYREEATARGYPCRWLGDKVDRGR